MLHPDLYAQVHSTWDRNNVPLHRGESWTTDAPFRETEKAIETHRAEGIVAVEMEAAALHALAQAKAYAIICFAHITDQTAQQDDDFVKGLDQGSQTALHIIQQVR